MKLLRNFTMQVDKLLRRMLCKEQRKLLLVCCVFFCVFHGDNAFNLDIRTATVHTGPSGSMFGFSVSLYKDQANTWTLIGAPKAQTTQPNVTTGGAVYRCHTDSSRGCVQIPFDDKGPSYKSLYGRWEQEDEKSNQWFGATVDSVEKEGLIVACAPRYVYYSTNLRRREPVGTCWIARNSLGFFEEYAPCRTGAWGQYRQGSCQAGLSAAFAEDGKRLFVGAVGSWYWQGQVFSKDLTAGDEDYSTPESPSRYDDSYLGYSSAAGEFTGDSSPDVVVGMPRGNNLAGVAVLYDYRMENLENITGEQLGAYFGHSVCVSDVNGDGLDDIVVGAPLYTDIESKAGKYEEGRVYVYYQTTEHKFDAPGTTSTLDGEFTKGRFGLALASLKDINRDGFQDFAVGAPYAGKDEKGLVYIYHGSPTGIRAKPSQVITPEDVGDPGLNTLGFSINGGLDMDSNDYPDILIGAYNSDKAIFMRSRPVVNLTSSMQLSKNVISLEDKTCTRRVNKTKVACVNAEFCLLYNGIGVDSELDIVYNLTADAEQKSPRAFFLAEETPRYTRTLRLRKNVQYCRNATVYILNKIRDKLSPILIKVEYGLVDTEPYRYVLKPILNQNVLNLASKELKIEKNCGGDDICVPDLQLLATPNMEEYAIGHGKRLEINVLIHNAGEDAFEAMMYVKLPLDVNYVNINKSKLDFPVSCSGAQPDRTGVNELVCDIGNPLPANKTLNFAIILAPSRVVSSVKDLVFSLVVNSTNEESKETLYNNEEEIVLPVRVKVNFVIRGISRPPHESLNKSKELPEEKVGETDVGPQVIHTYEVINLRGSRNAIPKADVYLLWPSYTLDGKFLLYMMEQPDVKGSGRCDKVENVNPLKLSEIRKKPKDQYYGSLTNPKDSLREQERMKRNAEERGSEEKNLKDGKNNLEEELSCGATNCTLIYCSISNLEEGDSVAFSIRSRLWKETYEQFGLEEVQTSSKMIVKITELPYGVDPDYLSYEMLKVHTKVSVLEVGFHPYAVPWWIIILAVVGGLLLLALLALVLWKLGFFERKRVKDENEKVMLHEKNGYHMVRGDAAL